jgi:hypothetical protein
MTVDRRVLAGALASLLLVAACGGSATQAPGASQASGATQSPEASQAPADTPAAVESQAPNATNGPDVSLAPGAAADLEAKLPSEVNGVTFTKTSFDGNSIPAGVPIGDTGMEKFLKDNGKGLQDVRLAIATPAGAAASAGTLVMALQIKGVDSGKLETWAIGQLGDTGATKQNVGGKNVYGQVVPGAGGSYFYVKDDAIYYVVSMGGPAGLAEAIISKLP